jgi:tRNA 2-selenouridine synthase
MIPRLLPKDFLENPTQIPILDVRSPGEFAQGHIVGAINLPLFSDEERAIIGTLYKKNGKESAFLRGLDLVGPKLSHFVKTAAKISPTRKLRIHCWRGGMRSESMAMLMKYSGFETQLLQGGYKGYRNFVLESFFEPTDILILGGKTGSGKTEILKHLVDLGEQIIDLEGLANHKGSAFGHILQAPQPTIEQFENNLFAYLGKLDKSKPIWVEAESRNIGMSVIPQGFWNQMLKAPLFVVNVPDNVRVTRLISEYAQANKEDLLACLFNITKRLGGLETKLATEAFEQGDLAAATKIVLFYYDKTYAHSQKKRTPTKVAQVDFEEGDDMLAMARKLLALR